MWPANGNFSESSNDPFFTHSNSLIKDVYNLEKRNFFKNDGTIKEASSAS